MNDVDEILSIAECHQERDSGPENALVSLRVVSDLAASYGLTEHEKARIYDAVFSLLSMGSDVFADYTHGVDS